MEQKSEVLSIVKRRLNLDDQLDALVTSYIDEIGARIRHYCNLDEIPEALKYTWAAMVIDALRIEQPNLPEIQETSGEAEQISIGDTSTAPAQKSGLTNTAKSAIDQVVLNYRVDLNRYRRFRW